MIENARRPRVRFITRNLLLSNQRSIGAMGRRFVIVESVVNRSSVCPYEFGVSIVGILVYLVS